MLIYYLWSYLLVFSILYSFPLIDFVILDMCFFFYLVINEELSLLKILLLSSLNTASR